MSVYMSVFIKLAERAAERSETDRPSSGTTDSSSSTHRREGLAFT